MKQRIIKQITKKLNITEEYLAGYLGITLSLLQEIKHSKGWSKDGKDQRLYRLNKIINILRNKGLKKPEDFKNILDNERFMFKSDEEDYSYITIINCPLIDMSELVNKLVFEIKVQYVLEKTEVSRSMLSGLLDSTLNNLVNKSTQIDKLYSLIKKIIKINKTFHFSFLLEPFNQINDNTPLFYIVEGAEFYTKLIPNLETIITEFYKE